MIPSLTPAASQRCVSEAESRAPQGSGLSSLFGPLATLACESAAALRRTFIGEPETPVLSPTLEGAEFTSKFSFDKTRPMRGHLFAVPGSDGTVRHEVRKLLGTRNADRIEAEWHNRGVSLSCVTRDSAVALFLHSTEMPRDGRSAREGERTQNGLLGFENCAFSDDLVATLWLARIMKKARELGADLRLPIHEQLEPTTSRKKPRFPNTPVRLQGGVWVQASPLVNLSPGESQALLLPVRTHSGVIGMSSGKLTVSYDSGAKSRWVRALGTPNSDSR